jgi:pantoate--beta-alanine ligase
MRVVRTIAGVRAEVGTARAAGRTVGLVPTMGAFHDGHLALMRAARERCDEVVVSLFVNPAQFEEAGDLAAYPRDEARDAALAEAAGVDVLFAPAPEEVYPPGFATAVTVAGLGEVLEGAARGAGHFAGVCTVVAKLLNIVGPDAAFFGAKDAQQVAVVRRMAADLDVPARIEVVPTVREPDGLAMSSRNVYLTPEERAAAPVIHRALQAGAAAIVAGERDPEVVRKLVAGIIEAEPATDVDYIEIVADGTVERPTELAGTVRLVTAVRLGRPRLLDNLAVTVPA